MNSYTNLYGNNPPSLWSSLGYGGTQPSINLQAPAATGGPWAGFGGPTSYYPSYPASGGMPGYGSSVVIDLNALSKATSQTGTAPATGTPTPTTSAQTTQEPTNTSTAGTATESIRRPRPINESYHRPTWPESTTVPGAYTDYLKEGLFHAERDRDSLKSKAEKLGRELGSLSSQMTKDWKDIDYACSFARTHAETDPDVTKAHIDLRDNLIPRLEQWATSVMKTAKSLVETQKAYQSCSDRAIEAAKKQIHLADVEKITLGEAQDTMKVIPPSYRCIEQGELDECPWTRYIAARTQKKIPRDTSIPFYDSMPAPSTQTAGTGQTTATATATATGTNTSFVPTAPRSQPSIYNSLGTGPGADNALWGRGMASIYGTGWQQQQQQVEAEQQRLRTLQSQSQYGYALPGPYTGSTLYPGTGQSISLGQALGLGLW